LKIHNDTTFRVILCLARWSSSLSNVMGPASMPAQIQLMGLVNISFEAWRTERKRWDTGRPGQPASLNRRFIGHDSLNHTIYFHRRGGERDGSQVVRANCQNYIAILLKSVLTPRNKTRWVGPPLTLSLQAWAGFNAGRIRVGLGWTNPSSNSSVLCIIVEKLCSSVLYHFQN